MAALLHDIIENTFITLQDIKQIFCKTVKNLAKGVLKLDELNFRNKKKFKQKKSQNNYWYSASYLSCFN